MAPVEVGAFHIGLILDPPVNERMADGVPDIVAEIAGEIGQGLLLLLAGMDFRNFRQAALEKVIHMKVMHIGAHIAVISVAQDRNIVKENIRALEAELIEPAVFGYHML